MAATEHWVTPWAALGRAGMDYMALPDAGGAWRWEGGGTLWLCVPDGVSVTIDGASHESSTGLAGGTPAYMAPEQMEGRTVGPKADLYALGIVM